MSHETVILVVGLVAEDNDDTASLPQEAFADFEEQTVYEIDVRLRTGKALPDCLMTMVSSQDELQTLTTAVEGRGIRLALMTDERGREKPRTIEALLAQLPQHTPSAPKGGDDHLFNILP